MSGLLILSAFICGYMVFGFLACWRDFDKLRTGLGGSAVDRIGVPFVKLRTGIGGCFGLQREIERAEVGNFLRLIW